MLRSIVVGVVLLAVTSAFSVTRSSNRPSTTITMAAEKSKSLPFLPQPQNIVGMAGDVGFDPFGFSDKLDVRWLREAELKHGRICMLATLGWVASGYVQLPGAVHQVSAIAAHDAAVSSGAMSQILLWVSFFEIISLKVIYEMMDKENPTARLPGDFSFDPFDLYFGRNEATQKDMVIKELTHGRLAMMAFSGIVTEAVITGKAFPYI
mmetsp:Transcript_31011/g.29619  ORF Transcript_31011/g.29619 Transcript_31011/m.29619 type:complete len:208 (-) Transcript_31011:232-855(-)